MKRSLTCMLCASVLVVFAASVAQASISIYTSRSAWEAAVSYDFEEEFFSDATLNPGVSVVSTYPGYIDTSRGVWYDRLTVPGQTYWPGEPEATTTTWEFATPLVGYGGNWDLAGPGGPGSNIAVSYYGSWVSVGEIPNSYADGFWGFVSTDPFSKVRLQSGSNPEGAWCETYELDNMVYSPPVPEPSSILALAAGLAGLGGMIRRRK